MLCGRGGACPARGFVATRNLRANRVYGFPLRGKLSPQVTDEGEPAGHSPLIRRAGAPPSPPRGKAFAPPCNFCKNLRKKSQLDFRRVDGILLLYEIELLENEQFTIEQYIAKQKSTEKQVIPNV